MVHGSLVRNTTSIIIGLGVFLALFGLFTGFPDIWFFGYLPFYVALCIIIYETAISMKVNEEYSLWDLKEFSQHEQMSIDSLNEVFAEEEPGGDFNLRTVLSGTIKGKPDLLSPFERQKCLAYRLTIGLVKAGDISRNTYSVKLLVEENCQEIELWQGDKYIRIAGGGILNLSRQQEKIISWNNLSSIATELKKKIDNALSLQKINKAPYTGIKVSEQVLLPDHDYTIYGICVKQSSGIYLQGTNIVDDPRSLFITDVNPEQRKNRLKSMKKRNLLRRLIIFPFFALALWIGAFHFLNDFFLHLPFLNTLQKGYIYYREAGKGSRIALKGFEDQQGQEYVYWTFKKSDQGEDTQLILVEDPIWVNNNTNIQIYRLNQTEQTYWIGSHEYIKWQGAYWQLVLEEEFPQYATPSHRKDVIYIKNDTQEDIRITFTQQSERIDETCWWEWEAGDGLDENYGLYATINLFDDNDEKIGEEDLLLETRDVIHLHINDKHICDYRLGYNSEVDYIDDVGWYLYLDEQRIKSHHQKLYIKNPTDYEFEVVLLNPDSSKMYDTYWTFKPKDGLDFDQGLYLNYDLYDLYDLAEQDEPVLVYSGIGVELTRIGKDLLWEGMLENCPYAEYDYNEFKWLVIVE